MKMIKYNPELRKFQLHLPNPDDTFTVYPANGSTIWRFYYYILDHGDDEDIIIRRAISALRALFSTHILEDLQITSIVSPKSAISLKYQNMEFVFLPGDNVKDALVVQRDGWVFTINIDKKGF